MISSPIQSKFEDLKIAPESGYGANSEVEALAGTIAIACEEEGTRNVQTIYSKIQIEDVVLTPPPGVETYPDDFEK